MNTWLLWLHWSRRDLRRRWLQVLAIALIIALGTGIYSGLISTSSWRRDANNASYALLNMYDLRLSLTEGSYLNHDELLQTLAGIEHAAWVTGVEPRLLLQTLVDVSTETQTIIVPGLLIGSEPAATGESINGVHITAGRGFTPADRDASVAVLEHKFATYYTLPPEGELRLSGDEALRYIGTGLAPEYFMVFTEEGGMMAEANFAAVFVPLATAQRLGDKADMVNDVLFTLAPDADPNMIKSELETAIEGIASVGLSFMQPPDDPAYHMLYEDIEQDEKFWRWMAYIFLSAAVFGAFNLATRLVESQRREIGIQMALGLPSYRIAIRPLLVALQIAALGVFFGLVIGLIVGNAFGCIIQKMIPMPVFLMPFQSRTFLEAAVLGIALPLLATLIPVIRALRVEPIDAIKTGHLVAKSGGLAPLLPGRILSGKILTQMPLRNLLLAPRRTLLTLLGIAAAIALLVLIMGVLDSMDATLNQARSELLQAQPQRLIVKLNFFYPEQSPIVSNVSQAPVVGTAEPALQLGGYLIHAGTTVETLLDLVSMESTLWRPSISRGAYPGERPGLLLSERAAYDLGVQPGDTITLRHPRRTGLLSYDWVETEVLVSGTHPLPLRFQSYMDLRHADMMGLSGIINAVQVIPAPGVTQDEVKQALFDQYGVASVQPVAALIRVFEELIGEFVSIFSVMQVAAVVLALLIAYNSTSINLDERAREMATMFAYGVRIRTALRVAVTENLLASVLGTLVGYGVGVLLMVFMLTQVFSTVIRDIELTVSLELLTLGIAFLVGVLVAVLTPLLSVSKMMQMDIPSTLRVME